MKLTYLTLDRVSVRVTNNSTLDALNTTIQATFGILLLFNTGSLKPINTREMDSCYEDWLTVCKSSNNK